jgi:signal transduction histidine kinase
MAERAERLGGVLKVSSNPHKGTCVSVCIDKVQG